MSDKLTKADLLHLLDQQRMLIELQGQQIAALTTASAARANAATTPAKRITVADLIARFETLKAGSSSMRTYRAGLKAIRDGIPEFEVAGLGDTYVDQVVPSDLEVFKKPIHERALAANKQRDTARYMAGRRQINGDGETAVYNAVGAWRALFGLAVRDGYLTENPADKVKKPSRKEGTRGSIEAERVAEVLDLAESGGDDPQLDQELCLFHLITGARREGALNLELRMIDVEWGTVVLDEKNGKVEKQPVPDWYAQHLRDWAVSRGAGQPSDPVFRKRHPNGAFTPISGRRYDSLFQRIQASSHWADGVGLTAHVLRHSTATYVERIAGKAVAREFLRHSRQDVTDDYTQATKAEVAAAVIEIWGGSHPLVRQAAD